MKRQGQTMNSKMRCQIEDRMLFGIIPFYNNVEVTFKYADQANKYIKAVEYLLSKGCNFRALWGFLNVAGALRACDPKVKHVSVTQWQWGRRGEPRKAYVPKARQIYQLKEAMKRLGARIEQMEKTGFLTLINQQETSAWFAQMGVNPDEVDDLSTTFPYVALPKWLNKRASMYERYLELASENILPKKVGSTRMARACIASYVKYATGHIYCVAIRALLRGLGLGDVSASQLIRETREFERYYPLSYSQLTGQFPMAHRPTLLVDKMHTGTIPGHEWNTFESVGPESKVEDQSVVRVIWQESILLPRNVVRDVTRVSRSAAAHPKNLKRDRQASVTKARLGEHFKIEHRKERQKELGEACISIQFIEVNRCEQWRVITQHFVSTPLSEVKR
jgi:hypothetical protein